MVAKYFKIESMCNDLTWLIDWVSSEAGASQLLHEVTARLPACCLAGIEEPFTIKGVSSGFVCGAKLSPIADIHC